MAKTSTLTIQVRSLVLFLMLVVAPIGLFVFSDLWIGTYAMVLLQQNAFWLIPVAVALAGVLALGMNARGLAAGIATLAVLGGIFGAIYMFATIGYQKKQAYLASVTQTSNQQPTLSERAPWDVADAQAPNAQGTFRGKIDRTAYIADKDVYGSIIRKSGRGSSSYVGVMEQTVAFTGQSTVSVCEFSKAADKRLGGYFTHNLHRALSHKERGLIIDDQDTYGYCQADTPMVVVPLKRLKGVFPAVEVPAGVAVYNGRTGELELRKNVKEGELPGPVYPMSLAAKQRAALVALDGSWWQTLRGQAGYADTSQDGNDPNGSNRSEMVLATKDGADMFATPLTMRGRSGAIAAMSLIEGGSVTSGKLNPARVHQLSEARKANSSVVDRVKTEYADLPDWAAGMTVFEIAPTAHNEWVASLGQKQNVAYRLRIKIDGSSCLETADGTKIRCGQRSGGSFGTTTEDPANTGATPPVKLPANAAELAKMSDEDIATLHKQLTDELVRRINTK